MKSVRNKSVSFNRVFIVCAHAHNENLGVVCSAFLISHVLSFRFVISKNIFNSSFLRLSKLCHLILCMAPSNAQSVLIQTSLSIAFSLIKVFSLPIDCNFSTVSIPTIFNLSAKTFPIFGRVVRSSFRAVIYF